MNNQNSQKNETNQDKQIHELSKKRSRKWVLKRVTALFCAAVILLTMNGLKRHADTLEHKPSCGYKEHLHDSTCYDDSGNVVCGMIEHVHTDACYQTRPSGDDEVLTIDSDGDIPVEGVDVEQGDLTLDLNADELLVDDVAANVAEPKASSEEEKIFTLGESAKLSTIIKELELGIKRKQIETVGAIENDDEHIGLIRVDALEKDWLVTAERDFDEAELAIVLADDIVVVKLRDGRAAVVPFVPEQPVTPVGQEAQPDLSAVKEAVEVPVVEDELVVEAGFAVEQPTGEQPKQSAAEDPKQPAEEETKQPTEEETKQPSEKLPEQPAVDEPVEKLPEQPAVDEPTEEQPEQPAVDEPTEEQPEQPAAEEPDEEQSGQPADEQPAEEQSEQPADEQPAEEQSEQPADEQPVEKLPEQPVVDEPIEKQPEQPEVEESAEEQPEQPADEQLTEEQPERAARGGRVCRGTARAAH